MGEALFREGPAAAAAPAAAPPAKRRRGGNLHPRLDAVKDIVTERERRKMLFKNLPAAGLTSSGLGGTARIKGMRNSMRLLVDAVEQPDDATAEAQSQQQDADAPATGAAD